MKVYALLLCVMALLVAVSCSMGPSTPQPGTPAFYWDAAKTTFRSGDLVKTNDDLLEIVQGDNEFATRARNWLIVLAAGMSDGATELAKAYEAGSKVNHANSLQFHKQVTILHTLASHSALDFAQSVKTLVEKDQSPDILLAFEFPPGSANEPAILKRVSAGLLIQESESTALQAAMLERGTIRALTAAVGSPDNSPKAVELFRAGEVRVPRPVFLFAAAKMLYDQSNLFGTRQLDQPQREKALCDTALAALKAIPETKESKSMASAIEAAIKKIPTT